MVLLYCTWSLELIFLHSFLCFLSFVLLSWKFLCSFTLSYLHSCCLNTFFLSIIFFFYVFDFVLRHFFHFIFHFLCASTSFFSFLLFFLHFLTRIFCNTVTRVQVHIAFSIVEVIVNHFFLKFTNALHFASQSMKFE